MIKDLEVIKGNLVAIYGDVHSMRDSIEQDECAFSETFASVIDYLCKDGEISQDTYMNVIYKLDNNGINLEDTEDILKIKTYAGT